MELTVDDRIILLPTDFNLCPEYWRNFVSSISPNIVRATLAIEYNVVKYNIKEMHDNYGIKIVREVVFKSRDDLVFFNLKWC